MSWRGRGLRWRDPGRAGEARAGEACQVVIQGSVPHVRNRRRGRAAIVRQFASARQRYGQPDRATLRTFNAEPLVLVELAGTPVALIHLETRGGQIAALRVLRDLVRLGALLDGSASSRRRGATESRSSW